MAGGSLAGCAGARGEQTGYARRQDPVGCSNAAGETPGGQLTGIQVNGPPPPPFGVLTQFWAAAMEETVLRRTGSHLRLPLLGPR